MALDLVLDPVFTEPFDCAAPLCGRSEQLKACQKTLGSFIAKEIVEEVADPGRGGLYVAFFRVTKKDTADLQGCWDGRALNEHICYEHFKMEGAHMVRDLVQPKGWLTKVEISEASASV